MNELIKRFDAAVPSQWEAYATPSVASVSAIEAHFGMELPALLVEFALYSMSFSSFFLSLGPDLENPSHIIEKNRFVRTDEDWLKASNYHPAPLHLVFGTENFMEDHFWCLDTRAKKQECPFVLWAPCTGERAHYPCFDSLIIAQIAHYESNRRKHEI